MESKDRLFVFALLLLSLGLFGSLSLTYCVWNKQTELKNELRGEVQNELKNVLQVVLNSREHLGDNKLFKDKGQLKRNVRQADEDTDTPSAAEILINALTEINEIKQLLLPYMNCSKNEYNQINCTLELEPGSKGEPGPSGPAVRKEQKENQVTEA